ncbi:MAG TPA: isocitrate/isopropylmalate family dehydrogenase [Candidatus Nanoarchaeia archaeon]|nr:isocitrate/isopropylmalate family dehydrogenase [Candidatus Nanoarchaeia archaeon]
MGDIHKVAVIPGDLNGIIVTDAAQELFRGVAHTLSKPLQQTNLPYGADYFLEGGITELGEEELEALKRYDAIFLGAVGDPTKIPPGVLEVGILLKVRQAFDQYVNLRPVILPEGVPSILVGKTPADINFEICRENSEGLYAAVGRIENQGTEDEVGIQEMRCSYRGVRRLADFAADRALNRPEKREDRVPRLHFVFKTNILTYAAHPWTRVMEEWKGFSYLDVRYMHIDNFLMQMLLDPSQFDVVLTENMFGDIATDAGAIIQGGIGSAVSGNINPTGAYPSMFEPIHGTAPDKWYGPDGKHDPSLVQLMKPEAAFLSYAMMLDQLKEPTAASLMRNAALNNLRDPHYQRKSLNDLVSQARDFARSQ